MWAKLRTNTILHKAGAILLALALWQLAAVIWDESLLLVAPTTVVARLFQLCREAAFWQSILYSFWRIVLGFALGITAAFLLALISYKFPPVETLLWPYVMATQTVPVASFIIIALVFFSSQWLSIFISFLMVFPVLYGSLLQGLKAIDPGMLEMAQLYHLPWSRRLGYLYLPQLKPFLLSSCSTALGLCWKSGIAAEVIGIPAGSIGERLYEAKIYLATAELFAWTLVIVLVSVGFEKLVVRLIRLAYERWEVHG